MIDPKLKTYITGLLLSCPLSSVQDDCPLEDKRIKFSLSEKFSFAEEISLDSAMHLIQHHKECMHNRKIIS